jgi:hypothetical protein
MKNKMVNQNEKLSEITINDITIKKGQEVYYARIIPKVGVCYVQTLIIRTIYETSFVGIDLITKTAQFIAANLLGTKVFLTRAEVNRVIKEAQKSGTIRKFKSEDEDNNE